MKRSFLILLIQGLLLATLAAQSTQEATAYNIVPNHSFEDFSGTPIGWYYKGAHFDNVMQFWNSPTSTSPDIFGQGIRVPNSWRHKGFGDQPAQHGQRYIGLTMYGCSHGKPHCREYVQIQLQEPLVVGQRYEVVYYLSQLPRAMSSNNMAIHFSETQYEYRTEEFLHFESHVQQKEITTVSPQRWQKMTFEYIADTPASYLIIGNFQDDAQTEVSQSAEQDLQYAYYYFDNISVIKKRPYINVPELPNQLLYNEIKTGEIIVLENIFFDLNKTALLPRSHRALQDLIDLMLSQPNLRIEIRGHTDNQGDSAYNQDLSFERAESVVNYLHTRGAISKSRLQYKGFGDSQPSASNETLEGRQQNRRVEFLVLSQ